MALTLLHCEQIPLSTAYTCLCYYSFSLPSFPPSSWMDGSMSKVDPDDVENDTGQFWRTLYKLEKGFQESPNPLKMAQKVRVALQIQQITRSPFHLIIMSPLAWVEDIFYTTFARLNSISTICTSKQFLNKCFNPLYLHNNAWIRMLNAKAGNTMFLLCNQNPA